MLLLILSPQSKIKHRLGLRRGQLAALHVKQKENKVLYLIRSLTDQSIFEAAEFPYINISRIMIMEIHPSDFTIHSCNKHIYRFQLQRLQYDSQEAEVTIFATQFSVACVCTKHTFAHQAHICTPRLQCFVVTLFCLLSVLQILDA